MLAAYSNISYRVCVKKQYITRILYFPMPDCFTFFCPFVNFQAKCQFTTGISGVWKENCGKEFPSSAPCMWATYNQIINQINGTVVKNEILKVMKWNLRTVSTRFLEFTSGKLSWCWSHDARTHMLWNSTMCCKMGIVCCDITETQSLCWWFDAGRQHT